MRSVCFVTINNFSNIPVTRFIIEAVAKKYPTNVADSYVSGQYALQQVSNHVNLLPENHNTLSKFTFLSPIKKYINLWRFIHSHVKEGDILYTPDYQVIALFFIWRALFRKHRIAIVYHPFELIDENELTFMSRWMWSNTVKKAYKDISFVIFPEANRRDIFCKQAHYPATSTLIFANSTQPVNQALNKDSKHFFDEGVFVVGHIGSLGPDHYVDVLVSLLTKNKNNNKVGFLVVGNYVQSVKSKLLAADNPYLILKEKVPHSELDHYYRQIDFGLILYKAVSLNFDYCAPNKLYEYFSYGIPVLAHPLQGLTRLNIPDNMLHLIDFDKENRDKQMNAVFQNSHISKAELCKTFAESLSVQKELDKLLPVIDKLINEK